MLFTIKDFFTFFAIEEDWKYRFKSARALMYVDDLKLFLQIRSLSDCVNLQADLDTLVSWCALNCLELNVSKCHVLHFTRARSMINFNYSILGSSLSVVDEIRDLGVIMFSKFCMLIYLISSNVKSLTSFSVY
jgi:hypothetical protein